MICDLSFAEILCPLAIWLILIFFFTAICFATRSSILQLRRLHQIPCNHCVFYTGDYRLKCTVRPCEAFSEAAISCMDYERACKPRFHPLQLKTFLKDLFIFTMETVPYGKKN